MRELTAAPDLDGWAIVERLLKDLAALEDRLWLVVDDVHELGSAEALRQLELLLMRSPDELRFVLATRHDVRLGLHRLRLEGELTEIRAEDLRFSLGEARELFREAGVELPEPALVLLYERAEGWATGLRLAVLSLAGHPDPGRFAAEFSGSERTVIVLHEMAAGWFAEHGYPVDAIGHALAAQDWGLAVRLLADQWPGLQLDGQAATVHALLAGFPAAVAAADAELAAWWRRMSWRVGRWRRRSGIWGWRRGDRRRCRPGGAGNCRCCSGWSGCWWPASAGTCRR